MAAATAVRPHASSSRPLSVAIVGAGFGGIAAAIELKRHGISDIRILEQAPELGGTWYYNSYPGAACDVPSHLYSFSFAQRRDWSRLCSTQAEIDSYLNEVARTHDVERHIECNRKVTSCAWDEHDARWRIEFADGDRCEADAIVLATGVSHLLTGDSIYTLKLRRRGVDLDAAPNAAAINTTTVGQVMEPVTTHISESATLLESADLLTRAPHGQLPVLDAAGNYRGVVTARALTDGLADGGHNDATVATVVDMPASVTVTDRLEQTLDVLETARGPIAVLDVDHRNLVGWLTHQRVLLALHPPRSAPERSQDDPDAMPADTADQPRTG